jgi:hypothetical protein
MINAENQLLVSSLKHKQLEIRERELNFFVNNLNNVSVQAALFAGFAFRYEGGRLVQKNERRYVKLMRTRVMRAIGVCMWHGIRRSGWCVYAEH